MKVLNLSCEQDHAFEGWFSSLEDFQGQGERGLLRCPICDSGSVRRLPTAPRLHIGNDKSTKAPPARTRLLLDSIKAIMAGSEDVGERFAEEARRIHYLETKSRNIRGTATPDQRSELAEEGIEVLTLPHLIPPKESLQ